jgi:hypothetical protein
VTKIAYYRDENRMNDIYQLNQLFRMFFK